MALKFTSLLGFLLLVACAANAKNEIKILDQDGDNADVEQMAKYFCSKVKDEGYQISRFDSIKKLADYLNNLPVEHEYSSCANNKVVILEHLQVLLSSGNEDVCGNEKLGLIEVFHHRYISKRKAPNSPVVSNIIKSFFLNYASHIADLCAARENQLSGLDHKQNAEMDKMLDNFLETIDLKTPVRNYNDIFLVWGLVGGFPRSLRSKLSDYLSAGDKKVNIKMSNVEGFKSMQAACKNTLKPVYSKTLLPMLRLIDLGYFPSDQSFIELINGDPAVTRLYKLTLLCEAVLPVRVIQGDKSEPIDKMYLVKPEDVPQELESSEDNTIPADAIQVSPVEWHEQILPHVTPAEAKNRVKKIADNLKSRRFSLVRLAKFVIKSLKNRPAKGSKSLIFADTHEDFDEVAKSYISKVNVDKLAEDADEHSTEIVSRRKRSANPVVQMIKDILFLSFLAFLFLIVVGLVGATIAMPFIAIFG